MKYSKFRIYGQGKLSLNNSSQPANRQSKFHDNHLIIVRGTMNAIFLLIILGILVFTTGCDQNEEFEMADDVEKLPDPLETPNILAIDTKSIPFEIVTQSENRPTDLPLETITERQDEDLITTRNSCRNAL